VSTANDKQFMFPLRLKVLSVIEERKILYISEKINCHLRNGYFVTVNQFVMTTVDFNIGAPYSCLSSFQSAAELG
jgi:hypothetical protein